MNPGEVTRVVVRWTPQSIAVGAETPGTSQFSFRPDQLRQPGNGRRGYQRH